MKRETEPEPRRRCPCQGGEPRSDRPPLRVPVVTSDNLDDASTIYQPAPFTIRRVG